MLALVLSGAAQAASAPHGTLIVNTASATSTEDTTPVTASATTRVIVPTPALIDFLLYAPNVPGAAPLPVEPSVYLDGPQGSPAPLSAPQSLGFYGPIPLGSAVPLLSTLRAHQGEPLFLKLTDLDENKDPAVRETVLVTVSDAGTGDTEIVRLVETGVSTGIFAGYLPTVGSAATQQGGAPAAATATPYDGVLRVAIGDTLRCRYVDVDDAQDVTTDAVLVDPTGVVFDSRTGKPVDGASLTLVDVATGQPAQVVGDDGVSRFPSTVTSGAAVSDASGRRYTPAPGGFRFPLVAPGRYRLDVKPPAGYLAPSSVPDAELAAGPAGPYAVSPASRGEAFQVLAGPPVQTDVPVDPASTTLWVQKVARKASASVGDFVPYELTVSNLSAAAAARDVSLTDTLPAGLRYVPGSATRDGAPVADPAASADGRTLTFALGELAAGGATTVRLVVQVVPGARAGGQLVNEASAVSGTTGLVSNRATAPLRITEAFLTSRALIMGRVVVGECGATGPQDAPGLEGAHVFLEDGTWVASDVQGLFHFEGVRSGTHVVQLDLDSLPEGYEPVLCPKNSRSAGRAFSQFVDLQGGTQWRVDFHVHPRPAPAAVAPAPAADPAPAPASEPAPLAVEQRQHLEGGVLHHEVDVTVRSAPFKDVRVHVNLPPGVRFEEGSGSVNGAPVADPEREPGSGELVFDLGNSDGEWKRTLRYRAAVAPDAPAGELALRAHVTARDLPGREVASPRNEVIVRVRRARLLPAINLTLRPHFASFGAELTADDQRVLDEAAEQLSGLVIDRLTVTGHTDNQPISPRSRHIHADNRALSLARAGVVGHYLAEKLGLSQDAVVLDGQGELSPIASNRSAVGRARNRRVEVEVIGVRLGVPEVESIEAEPLAAESKASVAQASSTLPVTPAPQAATAGSSGAQVSAGAPALSTPAQAGAPSAAAAPSAVPAPGAAQASSPATAPTVQAAPGTAVSSGSAGAPGASSSASAGAAQATPGAAAAAAAAPRQGLLSPMDGDVLVDRINAVQVRVRSYLTVELLLDGKPVPQERIGFRAAEPDTRTTLLTYVGVDFGDVGEHTLQLKGTDPFGNVRVNETAHLRRSSEVAALRFVSAEGNVADGRTPVRMRFELLDATGTVLHAATRLDLRDSSLRPLRRPEDSLSLEDAAGRRWVQMDRDGWVSFDPVQATGTQHAVVALGGLTARGETYVAPKLRDWILVGLAEGGVGYNAVSKHLETLPAGAPTEDFYADGRLAFYAKGRVKGEWLLTLAYDNTKSRAEVGNSLFQTIDPNTYYTLYGDGTLQQYDAPSARKLYVKIEREQYYALFGDFDTGLGATDLSRYSRRLNGVKTELRLKHLDVNAFGTQTDLAYAREELQGDGTSGLYRLARGGLTANGEKVTIEVRDRFRTEVVLSTRTLTRFIDYSIDYDTGTLFFREPIPSRDLAFNPVFIVVEYETRSLDGQHLTAGGRAGLKLLDNRLKLGTTVVHEDRGERAGTLYGADFEADLTPTVKVRAELAHTEGQRADGTEGDGTAYLAEVSHRSHDWDARAYARLLPGDFGLGQQALTETGTRKLGVDAAYRFTDHLQLGGTGYRQHVFSTDATRDVAEARFGYTQGLSGASVGLRYAEDRLADGSEHLSTQAMAGTKLALLEDRLVLSVEHAQSLVNDENVDYPTRTLFGAEYKLTRKVTLLGAEELTWKDGVATAATRLGVRSTPWTGATVSSSMESQLRENSERLFGTLGLRQTLQLSEAWRADFGLERTQTFSREGTYLFNPAVPLTSGASEDFTAASTGATYQVRRFLWDSRAELRLGELSRRWNLLSGLVTETGAAWGWTGRLQLLDEHQHATGQGTRTAALRLGLVYRPPETRWIVLDRLDLIHERRTGSTDPGTGTRLVNNLSLNARPGEKLQVSVFAGAKYTREQLLGTVQAGYTDELGLEGRYDLTERLDVGLRASALHAWRGGQLAYSGGPSVGYNVVENMWLSAGYNVWGYEDRDFVASNYAVQGPYVRLRVKLDQQTVHDAARWLFGQ
ncbi:DUF11 domain-containing protein [Aggregicoccus sp. 17bor-14]|uniref:OmpA family protein n=1 Tax=Myxococcaceae TaxID=31 RepID=UPI00129D155A|nr:DUF11 domain-containing protein [Simulacricoccus sp. 17bor-14]MRI87329.1 DUF11 domain-containing protein [Aggregicoccus sp. 17bor-14]